MPITLPLWLKGMTELDRSQLTQTIIVPYVNIPAESIQSKRWKAVILALRSFKSIRDLKPRFKQILLDPNIIQSREDIIKCIPSIKDYVEQSFDYTQVTVTYDNYTIEQVIKAILPDELMKDKAVNTGSGYSLIGHVAHFNLRNEVLPYKYVIGEDSFREQYSMIEEKKS